MHSTAITRKDISRPMRWILGNVLLEPMRVLHYGEGKAYFDTLALERVSMYQVAVFEPYPANNEAWKAYPPCGHYDVCVSIYVLNTIEPEERAQVIDDMRKRADRIIVAVRTDKINGYPALDGVVTKRGTFQKSYSRSDCEELGNVLTYNSSYAIVDIT